MSKVLGIVAEFNPFHNGHLYHLTESKKQTRCDCSVAVMNGNFTQRGAPSLIDKWSKAQMALASGFDLVVELPTIYGISSSENFADGGVKILDSLGIVDILSFGTESGVLDELLTFANLFLEEPENYVALLKEALSAGNSFPKAREKAACTYLSDEKYDGILSTPNNILGIEYLKALKKLNSSITPFTIKRILSDYSSLEINSSFASSTAIRNLVNLNEFNKIKEVMPESAYAVLSSCLQNQNYVQSLSAYEKIILYKLRTMSLEEIRNLPDVSEGLEITLKTAAENCNNLSVLLDKCKSKRFTLTRIQRILLYALLGITKEDMEISKRILPYVRVLGMNSKGKELLSEICKQKPDLPVITSVKDFEKKNENPQLQRLLDIDKMATDIYALGYGNDVSYSNLDYTKKIIITS